VLRGQILQLRIIFQPAISPNSNMNLVLRNTFVEFETVKVKQHIFVVCEGKIPKYISESHRRMTKSL
jgi:hypothetical protein